MASVCISIKDQAVAAAFDTALYEASVVARDMIQVRTTIRNGVIVKTLRTDCPYALAVIRSAETVGLGND